MRSVVNLIEDNARRYPDHLFCVWNPNPNQTQSSKPRDVKNKKLYGMVMACHQSMSADFNIASGQRIALFMHSSLELLVYLFALVKLGCPVRLAHRRWPW